MNIIDIIYFILSMNLKLDRIYPISLVTTSLYTTWNNLSLAKEEEKCVVVPPHYHRNVGPLAKFRSKFVLEIRQLRKENPCISDAAKTRLEHFQKDNAESR